MLTDPISAARRTRINFIVDENLPVHQVAALVSPRGHSFVAHDIGTGDPLILFAAEEDGSVIVSADVWFYRQLRRASPGVTSRFRRAGVIKLPGHDWKLARRTLERWLPIIEAEYELAQHRADRRSVFDLRQNTALIDA